jgi:prepilin-type processing-associated H-X9-DG protein
MMTNCDSFNGRQKRIFCQFQREARLLISGRSGGTVSNRSCERAFTRLDLAVSLGVVFLLAGWFGFSHMGERGRIAQCACNLRKLGQAMQEYAGDHGGGLPAAGLTQSGATWDSILTPYLKSNLIVSNSVEAKRRLEAAAAPRFLCPSDKLIRENPRSYAMPAHDMQPEHWPLDANTASGVGLWWGKDEIIRLLGPEAVDMAADNPDVLPAVKLSIITAPTDTLLLTELIRQDNTLHHLNLTVVKDVGDQSERPNGDSIPYHRGRFNYLMVDGHVEWLTGLQTGGMDGKSGIWTIRKGD